MRILQLVATLGFGGVERMVTDLALEQKRAGHEPAIACLYRRQGAFLSPLEAAGIPVFGTEQPLVGGARRFQYLRDCLRRWPADVVYSPLNYSVLSQALACAAQGRRRPAFVVSQQSMTAGPRKTVLKVWLNARLARPFIRQFIAVSRYAARRAASMFGRPPNAFRIIYNGVRPEQFQFDPQARAELRGRLALPPDAYVWGSVGSLEYVKGYDVLLDAFAQARTLNPKLHLVLVGAGTQLDQLQQAARDLGCQPHVTLAGASSEVSRWLSAFDHYAQPSRYESFGMAPLEALASGLSVVATRIGGLAEIAEHSQAVSLVPVDGAAELGSLMAARSAATETPDRKSKLPEIFQLATVHAQYMAAFEACLRPSRRRAWETQV